jgi:HAD superfamily hydrolase (TIGR01549 family)
MRAFFRETLNPVDIECTIDMSSPHHQMLSGKAFVFDLDDTLVDTSQITQIANNEIVEWLRFPAGKDLIEDFMANLTASPEDPRGLVDVHEWRKVHMHQAFKYHGQNVDMASMTYERWNRIRLDRFKLSEDLSNALVKLGSFVPVGLLTNGNYKIQQEKVAACGMRSIMSNIVICGEIGCQKPDTAAFEYIADILNVKPSDCIMVGDSYRADIEGALDSSFYRAIWITEKDEGTHVLPKNVLKYRSVVKVKDPAVNQNLTLTLPSLLRSTMEFLENVYTA